jgi:putative cardiolipin synthase
MAMHDTEARIRGRRWSTRVAVTFATAALAGCSILPSVPPRAAEFALAPASFGALATVAAHAHEAAGLSVFKLLLGNEDALLWRLALADSASESIDAQYFIWSNDAAGGLLFERLLAAADRGVRVRLLVDDLTLASSDRNLAIYASHPNLEIRLYNPGKFRESTLGTVGDLILDFKDMNRRMHNKLFIADGLFGIVGGRNIGDAYFGLSDGYNFRDLDVLLAGPVLAEIRAAFDSYWNADLAYAADSLRGDVSATELAELRARLARNVVARDVPPAFQREAQDWTQRLATLPLSMQPGDARYLQDYPDRIDERRPRLRDMLGSVAVPSRRELLIMTPYLIPVGDLLADIAQLEASGVEVKILTASMGANNHTIAHSHYKKYRRRILETGADLYEFRHDPSAAARAAADTAPVRAQYVALHIKALVGDRRRCFIGSLNLDPRALEINTENGLYIESPALAAQLAAVFDELTGAPNAWRVELDADEHMRWTSFDGAVSRQPARSAGQRVADFLLRLLPIESQL